MCSTQNQVNNKILRCNFKWVSIHLEPTNIPSPMRWLVSVLTPLLIAHWGLKRKSIDWSGAISGKINVF